jgi:hypothetical protein
MTQLNDPSKSLRSQAGFPSQLPLNQVENMAGKAFDAFLFAILLALERSLGKNFA